MLDRRVRAVRMKPNPRWLNLRFRLGHLYRGGTQVTPTRWVADWDHAAQRWRALSVEVAVWRFTIKLFPLGPGPRHA
jgi:hypothetical protein